MQFLHQFSMGTDHNIFVMYFFLNFVITNFFTHFRDKYKSDVVMITLHRDLINISIGVSLVGQEQCESKKLARNLYSM